MLQPIICSPTIVKALATACLSGLLFLFGEDQNALMIAYTLVLLEATSRVLVIILRPEAKIVRRPSFLLHLTVVTIAFMAGQMLENFEPALSLVSYIISAFIIGGETMFILKNLHALDPNLLPDKLIMFIEKYLDEQLNFKTKKNAKK